MKTWIKCVGGILKVFELKVVNFNRPLCGRDISSRKIISWSSVKRQIKKVDDDDDLAANLSPDIML